MQTGNIIRALTDYFCDVSHAMIGDRKQLCAVFGYHRRKKEQRTVFLRGAETSAAPGFAIYPASAFCYWLHR